MSPAPNTFILTSSPFLLSQVTLASFVPTISQPHQDAKRPYGVQESDYSVQADTLFDGQMNTSSKTFFDVLATKFASFSAAHEKSSALKILSDSGKIYSLNNPDELFESIVFGPETGPEMQRWLERCKVRRLAPQFITGYRTFIDASVSREDQRATDVSGSATVPVSSTLGDPLGIADVEIRAGRHASNGVKTSVNAPGERIYAICYRKIKIKEFWGSNAIPSLDHTNRWKPIESLSRTEGEEDTYLEAGLSEGCGQGAAELYEAKSADGKSVMFGIVSDQDTFGNNDTSDSESNVEEEY